MKLFKRIMIWIFVILIFLVGVFNLVGFIFSAPGYKGPKSAHFDGKTFHNLNDIKAKGLKDVLTWSMNREQGEWSAPESFRYKEKPPTMVRGDSIRITFVNHATFLIQTQGINILTDPVWSERTSPFSFAGPKRVVPPGILFQDLPEIHAVIISHNHYDHLDVPTIKLLNDKFHPAFFVSLGISAFLTDLGVENSIDMDWWEENKISEDIRLACVPAQHFSGRGTFDRDKTLWAGFVIKTDAGSLYFAGDTGYGQFFKEIGQKYGPFKVSIIPIGAYKPNWFMSPIHISPEEAVIVHQDIGSQKSIAMHFGTFPLADDGREEPVNDLKEAIKKYQLAEDEFVAMENGEHLLIE